MNSGGVNVSVVASLPPRARESLSACPVTGDGVHRWLFTTALRLHRYLDPGSIVALLTDAVAGCGRDVPEREIFDAVSNSKRCADSDGRAGKRWRAWPEANLEQIEAIARNGIGMADLFEASPMRLASGPRSEEVVDLIFPGNPLICCGWTSDRFGTGTREEWRGQLSGLQFIVPSPMTAEGGRRKTDGEISPRTLDNTGPRRFLVVECDFSVVGRDGKTPTDKANLIRSLDADGISVADMCSAVLWRLAELAPLAMAVHSGGKSLHGWFPCSAVPESVLRKFMEYAASLGADPATWTRCQFVRMPDGLRPPGTRQAILFFNPEVL